MDIQRHDLDVNTYAYAYQHTNVSGIQFQRFIPPICLTYNDTQRIIYRSGQLYQKPEAGATKLYCRYDAEVAIECFQQTPQHTKLPAISALLSFLAYSSFNLSAFLRIVFIFVFSSGSVLRHLESISHTFRACICNMHFTTKKNYTFHQKNQQKNHKIQHYLPISSNFFSSLPAKDQKKSALYFSASF